MATGIKISQFTNSSPIEGNEFVPVIQNGRSAKVTVNQVLSSVATSNFFDTKIDNAVKEGRGTLQLEVENPASIGVNAGEGTIGIATNGEPWLKIGSSDTAWSKIYRNLNFNAVDIGAEPTLGNPVADDYILKSSADGVRAWVSISGMFIYENCVFVSKSGDDAAGERNNLMRPFFTVNAAEDAAQTGDTILVFPGDYSGETALVGKDGVSYQGMDGAILPAFNVTTAVAVKGSGLCQSLVCNNASAVMDMPGMDAVEYILCEGGTQTAGDAGTYIVCFGGTQTAGNAGTSIYCEGGTQTAGNAGTFMGCYGGTQTAGNAGTYIQCYGGTQTTGNAGTSIVCYGGGTQTAGNAGTFMECYGGTQTAGNAGTYIYCYGGTQTAGNAGTFIYCYGGTQTIRLTDQSHDGTTFAPVYLNNAGALNLYGDTSESIESGGTVVDIADGWSGSLFIDGVNLKATTVGANEATTGIIYGTGVTGSVTLKDVAIETAQNGTGIAKAIDAPSAQTVRILGTFSATHNVDGNITLDYSDLQLIPGDIGAISSTPAPVPISNTAPGTQGQWAYDSNNFYLCTSTNNWIKVPAISSF